MANRPCFFLIGLGFKLTYESGSVDKTRMICHYVRRFRVFLVPLSYHPTSKSSDSISMGMVYNALVIKDGRIVKTV
jgi:hypothetical protein